jgi:hypothetical protein
MGSHFCVLTTDIDTRNALVIRRNPRCLSRDATFKQHLLANFAIVSLIYQLAVTHPTSVKLLFSIGVIDTIDYNRLFYNDLVTDSIWSSFIMI